MKSFIAALSKMTPAQVQCLRWSLNEAVMANDEMADSGELSPYDRKEWRQAQRMLEAIDAEFPLAWTAKGHAS
jgi:hypothetical protein